MQISPDNFRNIIFDLGGVILEIDPQLSLKAFVDLGFNNFEEIFNKFVSDNLFYEFEKGQMSEKNFRDHIRSFTTDKLTDKEIDSAWNAMILGFPSERIDLLKKLNKTHRTFLLSNTNSIHWKYYFGILKKEFGMEDLSGVFEKEYYSHRMGKRKPGTEIFEFVLASENLVPEETLFIDDTLINIEDARKTGIVSYLLKENETINNIFDGFV